MSEAIAVPKNGKQPSYIDYQGKHKGLLGWGEKPLHYSRGGNRAPSEGHTRFLKATESYKAVSPR